MEKFFNSIPVVGGAAMPTLVINFASVGETIFFAAVGALTGFIVKILTEKLLRKLKLLK